MAYIQGEQRWGTGRAQIQGDIANIAPILKFIENMLLWDHLQQLNLAAYGNGKTYGIARMGPTLYGGYGPWMGWMAYYQGGILVILLLNQINIIMVRSNVTLNTA